MEDDDGEVRCLLRVAGLARHQHATDDKETHPMRVSAELMNALDIDIDATLNDAWDLFTCSGVDAPHARRTESRGAVPGGVLTREALANHVRTANRR